MWDITKAIADRENRDRTGAVPLSVAVHHALQHISRGLKQILLYDFDATIEFIVDPINGSPSILQQVHSNMSLPSGRHTDIAIVSYCVLELLTLEVVERGHEQHRSGAQCRNLNGRLHLPVLADVVSAGYLRHNITISIHWISIVGYERGDRGWNPGGRN